MRHALGSWQHHPTHAQEGKGVGKGHVFVMGEDQIEVRLCSRVLGLYTSFMPSIEMPDDFADDLYDSVYQRIGNALGNQQPQPLSWPEYSGAWLGLMYRYRSCADHDEVFTDSVNSFGDTPEWSERYKQERELFGFFVTGLSAIECACYGLFALGSWLNADQFSFMRDADKRVITPEWTLERFRVAFPNESLTRALQQITHDQQYRDWKKARNVLAHRSQPGRNIYLSNVGPPRTAEWVLQNIPIDSTATATRRRWLAGSLRLLLSEADTFTAKHF
jgi:hypothetical protein